MSDPVHDHLVDAISRLSPDPDAIPLADPDKMYRLLRAQLQSRHLDAAARWLQSRGEGFYTIGSSGHEGNAAIALALRTDDPALLHYRSGAFYCARAARLPGTTPLDDVVASLAAAVDDQMSGGRHKVIGNRHLSIIPQTSTIASHLPRAVGLAFALGRARRLGRPTPWPDDAVVVASFGDASVNHSTAAGALNAAARLAFAGIDLPLLLVCEDNGLGISTPTPEGWIANTLPGYRPIHYIAADGTRPQELLDRCDDAVTRVRTVRVPAVVHMRCVRYGGHAGSDAEIAYRSQRSIDAELSRDPIVATADALVSAGHVGGDEILALDRSLAAQVQQIAGSYLGARRLSSAADVMAPIPAGLAADPAEPDAAQSTPAQSTPAQSTPAQSTPAQSTPAHSTLAQAINAVLDEELAQRDNTLVFGQDVGRKGGVYGVTGGLQRRHGRLRVFDSLLDEQAILGTALGASLAGFLPICEIQYLAYVHNAADQLRGEAATLPFFSNGQYANGMAVRIASFAYQSGFGGHFHNDNSVAALRDIPGLTVAVPSNPSTAGELLRTCVQLADAGKTVVFCEPIALYHRRDLVASMTGAAQPGRVTTWGRGTDLGIVTFGNGVEMSVRASQRLSRDAGIDATVADLQWLAPLPVNDMLRVLRGVHHILVVDESRHSGGVAESVIAELVDAGVTADLARVTGHDSFVPTGPAADLVLVGEDDVVAAALRLCGRTSTATA